MQLSFKLRKFFFLIAFAFAGAASPRSLLAESLPLARAEIDQIALKTIAHVRQGSDIRASATLIDAPNLKRKGFRYYATNFHVAGHKELLELYLPCNDSQGNLQYDPNWYVNPENQQTLQDGKCKLWARVIAQDAKQDLAILEAWNISKEVAARQAPEPSALPRTGDTVYAIGNPVNQFWQVLPTTYANAGFLEAQFAEQKVGFDMHAINGLIAGGYSGGPLLDSFGKRVGILSAYNEGYNQSYAIRNETVSSLVNTIRHHSFFCLVNSSDAAVYFQYQFNDQELKSGVAAAHSDWCASTPSEVPLPAKIIFFAALGERKEFSLNTNLQLRGTDDVNETKRLSLAKNCNNSFYFENTDGQIALHAYRNTEDFIRRIAVARLLEIQKEFKEIKQQLADISSRMRP